MNGIDKLRQDLIDYYTLMSFTTPSALMEVLEVRKADDTTLIFMALRIGFDVNQYLNEEETRGR